MITSDIQLQQSEQAVVRLQRALRSLKERVYPRNPELFAAMAQSYLDDIRNIRAEIDIYVGAVEVSEATAPLWITLDGEGVNLGRLPSSVLSNWLGRVRKSVQAVAEYLEKGRARVHGRPDVTIAQRCDFEIVTFQPGSLRMGLRFPEPDRRSFLDEPSDSPDVALQKILEFASWAVSSAPLRVRSTSSDDTEEGLLVARQVLRLLPKRTERVQAVTFAGAILPRREPIRLVRDLRGRLTEAILGQTEQIFGEYEGVLREIDLDKKQVILRARPENAPELHCAVPETLMEEALEGLNRKVVIGAVHAPDKPTRVTIQWIQLSD